VQVKRLDDKVFVSDQISLSDLPELAAMGIQTLVCNRPDGESRDQATFSQLQAASAAHGMEAIHIPFRAGELTASHRDEFIELTNGDRKILAFCRTGNRSSALWATARQAQGESSESIVATASKAGFDVASVLGISEQETAHAGANRETHYEIVVVGAGTGGIAVAASLLKRNPKLRIALIDAATEHFYQPGWTMVGGGVFDAASTRRKTKQLIPDGATWIQQSVASFAPVADKVCLQDGREIHYQQLVVAPGLALNWEAIEGLSDTLGKNGVTSNYRYDLAPYTWELVQGLKKGKAVFTQPPMPIKCAGAPQKALYLSADHWFRQGALKDIDLHFYNAGGVLFGVEAYVPALMSYMEKYRAQLHFSHTLFKVDGVGKRAWFKTLDSAGEEHLTETEFDMLHVCPPQCSPKSVRDSALADDAGWLSVDQHTLQHKSYSNIWGLGDVMNTPNAKTMAAVRKQAPVVAHNICDVLQGSSPTMGYDGYGSCPLTVERGKIVLAEFGYGGKLMPTFPNWINDGTKPTTRAWLLKTRLLPAIYWHGMLKGREWLVAPRKLDS